MTTATWIVAVLGMAMIALLSGLQLVAVIRPRGQWTIENVYGGTPEATDPTAYFAFNQATAWADPFLLAPLQIAGSIGMLMGERWGFLLALMASVPLWYTAIFFFIWDRDLDFRETHWATGSSPGACGRRSESSKVCTASSGWSNERPMSVAWGVLVTLLSLLAWGGQALSWLSPKTAVRWKMMEAEEDVEPTYWADIRAEALWDGLTLWVMVVAGVLLIADADAWPYFGLVGGGMYLYFGGRGISARATMTRRGLRIGAPQSVRIGVVFLTIWTLMALVTIIAASITLHG